MTVTLVICAVLALPAGWLAGVVLDRVPENESWTPLPSVRLHGWYLFLHLTMLVTFVAVGARFDGRPPLLIAGYLLLMAALLVLSVIDIDCYRLPDRIVLPTLAASVVLVIVESVRSGAPVAIRYAMLGAFIYFGFLLVVHLISPRGMGFGDVKLAALMGLYLGWMAGDGITAFAVVLWAMLVGFVSGSVAGVVLLATRGRNAAIPFGPFLAFGTAVVVLLAPHLVGGPIVT